MGMDLEALAIINRGKRCDCEYIDSPLICGHPPGGCDNGHADIRVRHYGLRANLCLACFEATCNPDIYPLDEKLRAGFEVLLPEVPRG